MTHIADRMLEQLLPGNWVKELRFHPRRQWRFDYAWPSHKIALEVEGAVWTKGRHTRGSGFKNDIVKYNTALLYGWRVLRISREDFNRGRAGRLMEEALKRLPEVPTEAGQQGRLV